MNLWKKYVIWKKEIALDILFFYIRADRSFSENTKWVISFHGGSANFWAELDLNQRRHIANEFTVRPH